jgi:hypothetical protein
MTSIITSSAMISQFTARSIRTILPTIVLSSAVMNRYFPVACANHGARDTLAQGDISALRLYPPARTLPAMEMLPASRNHIAKNI